MRRWIAEVLSNRTDSLLHQVRRRVFELAEAFPLYAERREKAHAGVQA